MKLDDVDFRGLPQELIDFKDQVLTLVNFGKYQKQVISSIPNWRANLGEEVYFISGATGRLYVNTSAGTSSWKIVATFTP